MEKHSIKLKMVLCMYSMKAFVLGWKENLQQILSKVIIYYSERIK